MLDRTPIFACQKVHKCRYRKRFTHRSDGQWLRRLWQGRLGKNRAFPLATKTTEQIAKTAAKVCLCKAVERGRLRSTGVAACGQGPVFRTRAFFRIAVDLRSGGRIAFCALFVEGKAVGKARQGGGATVVQARGRNSLAEQIVDFEVRRRQGGGGAVAGRRGRVVESCRVGDTATVTATMRTRLG